MMKHCSCDFIDGIYIDIEFVKRGALLFWTRRLFLRYISCHPIAVDIQCSFHLFAYCPYYHGRYMVHHCEESPVVDRVNYPMQDAIRLIVGKKWSSRALCITFKNTRS